MNQYTLHEAAKRILEYKEEFGTTADDVLNFLARNATPKVQGRILSRGGKPVVEVVMDFIRANPHTWLSTIAHHVEENGGNGATAGSVMRSLERGGFLKRAYNRNPDTGRSDQEVWLENADAKPVKATKREAA